MNRHIDNFYGKKPNSMDVLIELNSHAKKDKNRNNKHIAIYNEDIENGDPEKLLKMGFRSIRFGTTLTQRERRKNISNILCAADEMSLILNVPQKFLSLGGTLSFETGTRGLIGATRARYNPQITAIQTRGDDMTTFAHEWFHAFDNYLGNVLERNDNYYSALVASDNIKKSSETEVYRFYKEMLKRMKHDESGHTSLFYARCLLLDCGGDPSNISKMEGSYWTDPIEMFARSFERFYIDKSKKSCKYACNKDDGRGGTMPRGKDAKAIDKLFSQLMVSAIAATI